MQQKKKKRGKNKLKQTKKKENKMRETSRTRTRHEIIEKCTTNKQNKIKYNLLKDLLFNIYCKT